MSWQPSSLANNYVLEEYPYNGGWGVAYDGANTSYTATVPGSGTYQFQVAACGAGGCSNYTTSGKVIVTLPPILSANTTSSISGTFSLSWNAVATATGYALSQNGTQVYGGSGTSWTPNNLGNGNYTYTVQSCNAAGCGGASEAVTVAVNHIPAPGLSASATSSSSGSFTLSWNTVADATSYELYQGGVLVYNSTGTSWTSSSLPNGTYAYTVYGCNGSTCGFASNAVTVTVLHLPLAPSLSANETTSHTRSFSLSWTTASGATGYQLNESINGGAWTAVYDGTGTAWSASGMADGTYAFQAFGSNASGWGAGSNVVTITARFIPLAPASLTLPPVVYSEKLFKVSWSASTGATSYILTDQDVDAKASQQWHTTIYRVSYLKQNGYLEKAISSTSDDPAVLATTNISLYDAFGRRIALDIRSRGTQQSGAGVRLRCRRGNPRAARRQRHRQQLHRQRERRLFGGALRLRPGPADRQRGRARRHRRALWRHRIQQRCGQQRLRGPGRRQHGLDRASRVWRCQPVVRGDRRQWLRGGHRHPAAGQTLKLPQVTTNSNTAETFKPYNPREISGSTTPSLPQAPMPAPSAHHCNTLAEIVVIAVAVVVSVATYETLAPEMEAWVAGAIAGAAGSAARMGLLSMAALGAARRMGASEEGAMESANLAFGVEMGFAGKTAEKPMVEFTGEASEGGVGSLEQSRAYYAAQDPDYDFTRSTFTTLGVDEATARDYLDTEQGQGLLEALQNAAPNDDYDTILARAMDALGSGTTLPNVEFIAGQGGSGWPGLDPYSGYLTTWEVLNDKPESMTLADYLGLPVGSEAPNYNVFKLPPLHPSATVYMSTVAPAIDSNGLIQHQYAAGMREIPGGYLFRAC